jgi:hypothetical protein
LQNRERYERRNTTKHRRRPPERDALSTPAIEHTGMTTVKTIWTGVY